MGESAMPMLQEGQAATPWWWCLLDVDVVCDKSTVLFPHSSAYGAGLFSSHQKGLSSLAVNATDLATIKLIH
jgi:hypothetical protein